MLNLQHYLYNPLNNYGETYVVEYGHISPTTLKAVVTDHRTTSLFVQMQMYGFHPTALPVEYKPFLSNSQTPATTGQISSLTQLKILMNAQPSTTKQQQQQQLESDTKRGLEEQLTELGHQISPDNNSKVHCMQQVLSSSSSNFGNDSQSVSSAHSSIFNLIVTIFVTMIIIV